MTPEELVAIREIHCRTPGDENLCECCLDWWPCDAAKLLAALDERDALLRDVLEVLHNYGFRPDGFRGEVVSGMLARISVALRGEISND